MVQYKKHCTGIVISVEEPNCRFFFKSRNSKLCVYFLFIFAQKCQMIGVGNTDFFVP
jgi:hypothetical protein